MPIPVFFVPAADNPELTYADLAKLCGRPVPPAGSRIYSITFRHNGEEWTATVGETLHGVRRRTTRSKGKTIESTQPVGDPALVLAIFAGPPFMVVTNYRIISNVRSAWENPFLAGEPTLIISFSS